MGTVVDTYFRYTDANNVASGGFGNVYKFPSQMAVKEEFKVCYGCSSNIIMYYFFSDH